MAIGDKIPVEAIKKALAENPVLKWAVIGFVAIFAVEFLAKEGLGFWVQMKKAPYDVARARAECEAAVFKRDMAGLSQGYEVFGRSEKERAQMAAECGALASSSVEGWQADWEKKQGQKKAEVMPGAGEGGKSDNPPPPRGGSDLLSDLCIALAAILGDRAFERWGRSKKDEGAKAAALRQTGVSLAVVAFMFAFLALTVPVPQFLSFEYPPREVFGIPLSHDVITALLVGPLVGAEILFFLALARQVLSLLGGGWRLLRKDAVA